MVEPTEQISLDALKKENKELKETLGWHSRDRKVWGMFWSFIAALVVCICAEILTIFALYGINAAVKLEEFDENTGRVWTGVINCSRGIVLLYIVYNVLIANMYRFQEELAVFGERLDIYFNAGRKALRKVDIAEELGIDPEKVRKMTDSEIEAEMKTHQKTLD